MKALLWIVVVVIGVVVVAALAAPSDEPIYRPPSDHEIIEPEADRFCDAHPEWEDCR